MQSHIVPLDSESNYYNANKAETTAKPGVISNGQLFSKGKMSVNDSQISVIWGANIYIL